MPVAGKQKSRNLLNVRTNKHTTESRIDMCSVLCFPV
jgi:hypothetical protein